MLHIIAILIIIILLPRALVVALPVLETIAPFLLKAVGILILLALVATVFVQREVDRENARAERAAFAARGICKDGTYIYNCSDTPEQREAARRQISELAGKYGNGQ